MARARQPTAQRDTMTTAMAMATGNDDNNVDGDSATDNEVDDDGDGVMGGDKDDGAMGSGATGYGDDDDGNGLTTTTTPC